MAVGSFSCGKDVGILALAQCGEALNGLPLPSKILEGSRTYFLDRYWGMSPKLVGDNILQRFDLRLSPSEAERRFRIRSLESDTRRSVALLLLTILFHATSIPSDLGLLRGSEAFRIVLAIRVAGIAFGLLALYLIRLGRGVGFFDSTMLAWSVFLCGSLVTANAYLPADYTAHIAWDILLTLGTYTVIPMSFSRQLFVASVLSVGNIILFAGHKIYTYPSTFPDVTLAFVCANLVGAFASWEMHRWRRELFVAFEGEKEARERFEVAQQEIRTLRGIISICASCKKVRTDEGQWRQVEAYVREHSEAEFSHSICPKCSEALYGEDG